MPATPDLKPTLGEFLDRVSQKYHIQRRTYRVTLTNADGKDPVQAEAEYLYREVNGQTHVCPLHDIDRNLALTPSVLRRLCDDLVIPYDEFDLTLDGLEEYTFGFYRE